VIWRDVNAGHVFNGDIYTWMQSGGFKLSVGFLIDPLTALMLLVVTFVSLMVHIYTIGYMSDDDGYILFFSYISLFTFSMLMLVMSNNFPAALLRLGGGRPRFLPADRVLQDARVGDLREPQGFPRQSRGRLRLRARHRSSSTPISARSTTRRFSRAPASSPARRSTCWVPRSGR
jgi:hypothetical protein